MKSAAIALPKPDHEVERLKAEWSRDPCGDIETTEGFEAHVEDLRAFREQSERKWGMEARMRLEKKAAELGCPNNIVLAGYVEGLEDRIRRLEEALG